MAETSDRLKRKRGTIRALTTKILQRIERNLAEPDVEKTELEEALDQLSVKELILQDLNRGIEEITENLEELEAEVEGAQEYQERITTWKGRATRRIQKGKEDDQGTSERSGGTRVTTTSNSTVKLPKLTLEKYYGDPSTWHNFWSQYDAAIHQNPHLGKTDKFNYLKSYLGGTAANAVSGLPLSNDNYDSAVTILTERFGRKDLVINAHMTKLLNLTPVKKSSDIGALRKLYDLCEVQIRSLESMGVISDTYGSLLCPILMKVIPDDIALEFSRGRKSDTEWKVLELLEFLKREIESRERTSLLTRSETTPTKTNSTENNYSNARFKPKGFSANGNRYNTASAAALNTALDSKCIFCDKLKDHKPEECHDVSIPDRREKLMKQGRCFLCLGQKHVARFCKSKVGPCTVCGRKHHKSVCVTTTKNEPRTDSPDKETVMSAVSPCNIGSKTEGTVLLQTAKVLADSEHSTKMLRCLLDGGSQRSFIREDISRDLGLPILGEESLIIHTFGSEEPQRTTLKRVKLVLRNLWNKNECIIIEALETPRVSSALVSVPGEEIVREMAARGLQMAETNTIENEPEPRLSILIGADYYWKVVSGKVQRLGRELVALETIFGWCVQGPTPISSLYIEGKSASVLKIVVDDDQTLSGQMKAFWEIESLGIRDNSIALSDSEEQSVRHFESTVKYEDSRYIVSLPWKSERQGLADNLDIAHKRFSGLLNRFRKNERFYDDYSKVINEYIEKRIAEPIPEKQDVCQETYYLPHHAVVRDDKTTTKLRVVFDASSHQNESLSLNDCLQPGPNLNPDLLNVLLKFRKYKIAFMSDIEQAFLQIVLSENDRDVVRFLWLDGLLKVGGEKPKIKVLRMTRVLFGVSSSPFLLAATLRHHIKKFENVHPEVCKLLMDSLYVDDLIAGADDVHDAFNVTIKSKEILNAAGMNLRKWKTNSRELQTLWDTNETEFNQDFESNDQNQATL